MITRLEDKELKRQSRRQLLKLAPVAALGVFAFPKVSDRLVAAGVRFSDWASGALFRSQHPAQTFSRFRGRSVCEVPLQRLRRARS